MSLHNDINNLNNTIEKKQRIAQKEENQKELHQRILLLLKKEIVFCFDNEVKSLQDINILILQLIRNKKQNIDIIKELYFDKYKKTLNIHDINFLEENYLKTIEKIKKEYSIIYQEEERTQKAIERIQKEEEEKTRQDQLYNLQKKQLIFNSFIKFLYTICIILLSPFLLIGFVVIAICKGK